MTDANIFVLRLCVFAVAHSLMALPKVKLFIISGKQKRQESYRLAYNLISFVLFGWTMSAYRNTPVIYLIPGIWSLVMYLMQAVFLAILVNCIRQTGMAEFLGLPKPDTDNSCKSRLITDGWYGIVRHPLYLFSMLFLLFNPVVTSRWLILIIFSFIYFIIGTLIEERRLIREFGDEYLHYRQRVPFIIPNLSKFHYSRPKAKK